MAETAIEWATHVWNPFTGCDLVSAGCRFCYALARAKRNQAQELGRERKALAQGKTPPQRRYMNDGDPQSSGPGFGFTVHWDKLAAPEQFPAAARVFVNSMSDVFHEDAPDDAIARLFAACAAQPDVSFLILTKRPQRMRDWFEWEGPGINRCGTVRNQFDWHYRSSCEPMARLFDWPLPNVWLGVSIENRHFVRRAELLRETPAAVRFISAEPLLGPLVPKVEGDEHNCVAWWPDGNDTPCVPYDGLDLLDIDWLIVGGESGAKDSRPMWLEWARDLVEYARHGSTDTRVFVKQLGKVLGKELCAGPKGGLIEAWPHDLRIRELPEVARV